MNRMKKIVRRGSVVLLGLLIMLLSIMIWNYLRFSSMQMQMTPAAKISLDEASLYQRFQDAIRIRTVSQPLSRLTEDSPLHQFRDYVQEAFPALHRAPFVRRTGIDFGDASIPRNRRTYRTGRLHGHCTVLSSIGPKPSKPMKELSGRPEEWPHSPELGSQQTNNVCPLVGTSRHPPEAPWLPSNQDARSAAKGRHFANRVLGLS